MIVPQLLAIAKVQVPSPFDSLISLASFAVYGYVMYHLCKQFGKGIGYTLGMTFLPFIFYPMLAFGDSVYQGGEESYTSESEAPAESSAPVVEQQPEQIAEATQTNGQTPAT